MAQQHSDLLWDLAGKQVWGRDSFQDQGPRQEHYLHRGKGRKGWGEGHRGLKICQQPMRSSVKVGSHPMRVVACDPWRKRQEWFDVALLATSEALQFILFLLRKALSLCPGHISSCQRRPWSSGQHWRPWLPRLYSKIAQYIIFERYKNSLYSCTDAYHLLNRRKKGMH